MTKFFYAPYSFENGTWIKNLCFRGRDLCVRDTIVKHLNATLIEVKPKESGFGNVRRNGSATGLRAEVVYGRADIAFITRFLLPLKVQYFETTRVFEVGTYVGLVRRAPEVPEILKLVLAFEGPVWLALLATTLLFPLAWAGGRADLTKCVFLTWGVLVQQGIRLPSCGLRHRMCFLLWALFTLVLATAFVAAFTDLLVSRVRLKDVDTLDDFLARGLTLVIPGSLKERDFSERLRGRTRATTHDMGRALAQMSCAVGGCGPRRFEEVLLAPNVGLSGSRVSAEWAARLARFCAADGQPLLHLMREHLFSYLGAYEVRSGWPLLGAVDAATVALQEAGLPQRWEEYSEMRAQLDGLFAKAPTDGARRLAPAHLQAAVFLLAAGLAASVAVFAGEQFVWWWRQNVLKTTEKDRRDV
ncbi:hypothetical protein R5R35_007045 [Gryllus longicercus]|uniref:Ionotropic glutamate receptor C-terminal domain-containing protein n=1 Tax=Gryllus longicercus TaxID=2509291 RepID=A0AAN9V6E1_9ORTH